MIFLKQNYGGNWYKFKDNYCPDATVPCYQWYLLEGKLKPVLLKIRPYLVTKVKILDLMLRRYGLKQDNPLLYKLMIQIKALKVSKKGKAGGKRIIIKT